MEPGNLDIVVPSSECAPLPSNIRVSNLGWNLGKSAASFLCNWEFKDKNTGLYEDIRGTFLLKIDLCFRWMILGNLTKGYLMLGPISIQNPNT